MPKKRKNLGGRPKEYDAVMQKKNLRLPEYIWDWLNSLAENRTKALIILYKKFFKK